LNLVPKYCAVAFLAQREFFALLFYEKSNKKHLACGQLYLRCKAAIINREAMHPVPAIWLKKFMFGSSV